MNLRPGGNIGGNRMPNEITIEDAVKTLKDMFTEVDESVLRLIIESNGGRMEPTVEHLLQITGQNVGSSNPGAPTNGDASSGQPKPKSSTQNGYVPPDVVSTSPKPENQPRQITQARYDVAHDFLRPPSWWKRHADQNSRDAVELKDLEKEDMKFAQILQDSLFMAELKKHPEWVLDKERKGNQKRPITTNEDNSFFTNEPITDTGVSKYESFKNKFSVLGTAARDKLATIAQRLQRNDGPEETYPTANYHALESIDDDEDNRPVRNDFR